jgi:hypothetical protein
MKRIAGIISVLIVIILFFFSLSGCKKSGNPVKFAQGTFPDSVYNLTGLNSQYDDYNSDIYVLSNFTPIIFSSNRNSSGGQFDLIEGTLGYQFDQTSGSFVVAGSMTANAFYTSLVKKANTPGNDFEIGRAHV